MTSSSARYSALSRQTPGDPTRPVLEITFRGHRRDICCAAFQPTSPSPSPTGADRSGVPPRLMTAGADGAVMLWDARPTTRALRFLGHRGPVLGCDYCPRSVAGTSVTLLASCGQDGYARLWAPNLRRTATTYPANYLVQQQQQQGGSGDGNGSSWRVHTGAARAIKFAQDGSHVVYTAGDDKSVKAWDLHYVAGASHYPSGEPNVCFRGSRFLGNFNATEAGEGGKALRGRGGGSHTNWVRCLAVQCARGGGGFSHYVASGGDDNVVHVWDTRSPHGGAVHTFCEHRASVRGLSFHRNGVHLAACDASGAINVFDLRRSSQSTGTRYGLLQHYADAHGSGGVAVNDVCFAPSLSSAATDSSWLLSAGDDGTAKLWDTAEGFLYCTVQAHTGPVRTVTFTDDGAYFATAGTDGVAMVWRSGLTTQQPQPPQPQSAQGIVRATGGAMQAYTYFGEGEEEAEGGAPVVSSEEMQRMAAPTQATPSSASATAAGAAADPSYAAWRRRHQCAEKQGDKTMDHSPEPKGAAPASGSSRSRGVDAGRPPLPPSPSRPTAPSASSAGGPRTALSGEFNAASGSGAEAASTRERSFERSEERYSHISTPQKEKEARSRQQSATADTAPRAGCDGDDGDGLREQASVARREKQIDLSEKRLANVENAVASLVEYVQEENAHRDRELTRMQDEAEQRHGRQREEMLALKTMMEQLIQQQTALLGRLGVAAPPKVPADAPQE